MKNMDLLHKLEGVHTVKSVMSLLDIDRNKAIYYIHKLRKRGYVRTSTTSDKTRIYNVSFENKLKGVNYYDIINKYSPVKITKNTYNIYGKKPTFEETLIFALKTNSFRTILASLGLFKKIEDWSQLYHLAKKNHIERQVGALYDLSRRVMRTRKMTKRFRNNVLPKKEYKYQFVIEGLKSKDFRKIEDEWRIYIPFNVKDLENYK